MKIELKLFASLRKYTPLKSDSNTCMLEIDEGTTISELLEHSGIPANLCKIIFVNGIHAKKADLLRDGDRLGIFPPVAGG